MKTLLISLAALTLLSCDPVKRHQRLVERYPYVHTSEITTVHDTFEVIVPQVKLDPEYYAKGIERVQRHVNQLKLF